MKLNQPQHAAPSSADRMRDIEPVICYPVGGLPLPDLSGLQAIRRTATQSDQITVLPRDAACIVVPAGAFFRITSVEGPQVGDLNLWNANDLNERFYSGKTRALHGTHLSTGDRMWSGFPMMRPMATRAT